MTGGADYPDFVARFYDTIYGSLRTGTDARFYLDRVVQAGGPVLELGVGTGRLFLEARKRGADIVGLDASPSMLAVLRSKLAPGDEERVLLQDARTMDLEQRFALVLAPFRVFSHLIETEDQLAVLERVHRHLRPGGSFLFDVYVPDLKMLLEGLDRHPDFEGEYAPGKKLRRATSMKADLVRQVSAVTMRYEWDEAGRRVEKEWTFSMRFFFRYELEHLVERSPLELVKVYGGFDGRDLDPSSREFILLCQRRG